MNRLLFHPLLAQAGSSQSVADLEDKVGDVLTIIMVFGQLYGVALIISGARQIRGGDYQGGKDAIISGALIAAAPTIMRILYAIFVV